MEVEQSKNKVFVFWTYFVVKYWTFWDSNIEFLMKPFEMFSLESVTGGASNTQLYSEGSK